MIKENIMLKLENFYYIIFISQSLKVIKIRKVTLVQTRWSDRWKQDFLI